MRKAIHTALSTIGIWMAGTQVSLTQVSGSEDFNESRLRILVAYTQEAENAMGGMTNANDLILNAVDELNQALQKSAIFHQYDLVRMVKINFTESDDFPDMAWQFHLQSYTNRLRAMYDADVMGLVVSTGGACGSPLIVDQVADLNTAYFAVGWECMKQAYGLPHMVGHLYGAGHPFVYDMNVQDDAYKPYGHGYQWAFLGSDCSFSTILGYYCDETCGQDESGNCNVIPYFSNPDIYYSGVPTGIDSLCDNASVIRANADSLEFYPLSSTWHTSDTVANADLALLQGKSQVYNGSHYWVKDSAMVWFRAGTRITLEPGFKADEGTYFETILDSAMLHMR